MLGYNTWKMNWKELTSCRGLLETSRDLPGGVEENHEKPLPSEIRIEPFPSINPKRDRFSLLSRCYRSGLTPCGLVDGQRRFRGTSCFHLQDLRVQGEESISLCRHVMSKSVPFSVEVKNAWSHTPTPPYVFMAWWLISTGTTWSFYNKRVELWIPQLSSRSAKTDNKMCNITVTEGSGTKTEPQHGGWAFGSTKTDLQQGEQIY
jgi:hypothetical protein